jgi:chromosome segregation ATPase
MSVELQELLAKCTPGPWEVGDFDKNGQRVIRSQFYEIATCWHHCVTSIEREMQANAELLAKAYEMAVSLCRLQDQVDFCEREINNYRRNARYEVADVLAALSERVTRLQGERDAAHEKRRELQGLLRDWQNHCATMGKILGCMGISDDVEAAAKQLKKSHAAAESSRAAIVKELESLTPGGSEFVGDAKRCLDFVRGRLETVISLAKERNELRDSRAELLKLLKAVRIHYSREHDESPPFPYEAVFSIPDWRKIEAALQSPKGTEPK